MGVPLPRNKLTDGMRSGGISPLLSETGIVVWAFGTGFWPIAHVLHAPSTIDSHPEHRRVAPALSKALAASKAKCQVRVHQIQVSLTATLANFVVGIHGVHALLQSVAAEHRSQAGAIRNACRLTRYAARAHRLGTYAEAFWQLTAEAYIRLHAGQEMGFAGRVYSRIVSGLRNASRVWTYVASPSP